ncbi:uncharacterized protein LOC130636644 isoform X2 [Hydractinia symbiolongicarpus]|uniref:uncharacterized protein LOC130636644 isoform X2 n=1 Tax=Hydractinia symbiolongicarpus TaxID=13093 RepID=UPI00254A0D4A|nr:uncharacterized protein LOC130636644 isoform X2 [Hydractinia symbiolongicarpus]
MRYKNLVFILVILYMFVAVLCRESKAKEKNQVTQEGKNSDEKASHNPEKPAGSTNTSEDYDTTQGYPILFPETHMMSLKRNLTSRPNISSKADADIDIDFEKLQNKSNVSTGDNGKCSKSVDLLFLLDSSESVKYANWKIIIQFVKDLCNRFQLHSTRVGVIRYASEAEVALPLTEFNNTGSRDRAIDDIFYKTGGTRTDIALKKAAELLNVEDQRSQVLMLVSDGPTNRLEIDKNHFVEGKDLVAGPADRLKENGVALFCIGVEPDSETPEEIDTMKEEMGVIASEPTKMHLFMSDGYRELERKTDLISKAACVVNGAWSLWSEYSPCSVTCGYGTKVRMRTCSNPSPENNGADCTGPRVEIEECDLGPCTGQADNKYATVSVRLPPLEEKQVTGKESQATGKETQTESKDTQTKVKQNGEKINKTMESVVNNSTNSTNNVQHNSTLEKQRLLLQANLTLNGTDQKNDSSGKPIVIKWFENSTLDLTDGNKTKPHANECYEGLEELKLDDKQYNASSVYTHDTDDEYIKKEYAPPNAKLNNEINGGGWCAEHKYAATGDKNQYLQFDLGKQMTIDAVATQGSHLLENWVKSYNLRYSDDAISWEYYSKNPLVGNKDRTGIQKNMLSPPVDARYIQLNPIEWNEQNEPEKHDICMRAALYKCREGAVAPVSKRGIIHSKFETNVKHNQLRQIPRGVVLKEREWSHLPDQKTTLTLLGYDRKKRQVHPHFHHKGHKRIFKKLRKTAKNIMRNLRKKLH